MPIWFWRSISVVSYVICVLLLILVETIGQVGNGAQLAADRAGPHPAVRA